MAAVLAMQRTHLDERKHRHGHLGAQGQESRHVDLVHWLFLRAGSVSRTCPPVDALRALADTFETRAEGQSLADSYQSAACPPAGSSSL